MSNIFIDNKYYYNIILIIINIINIEENNMSGLNKIILIGYIGIKGELKVSAKNDEKFKVISFSLAVQNGFGENKYTEWYNITAFNKLADIVNQYTTKGSKIYIEGSGKTEKWIASDNSKKEKFKVIAEEIVLLDSEIVSLDSEIVSLDSKKKAKPKTQDAEIKDDELPF
jgi:single-strand DNA-binding protein